MLRYPERLETEPELAFASLLWQYMTPHFPTASAHDVVSGFSDFFEPNKQDNNLNAGNTFGTTIVIMAQDTVGSSTDECFKIGYLRPNFNGASMRA